MKHAVVAGFLAALVLNAQPPKPGTATIEGRVYNSLTNAAIRKTTVILTANQIQLTAETDGEGRFQFSGLPAGTYRVRANRAGFHERQSRRPVVLAEADHARDVDIRMPPQSAIAGRVVDEDGDPV